MLRHLRNRGREGLSKEKGLEPSGGDQELSTVHIAHSLGWTSQKNKVPGQYWLMLVTSILTPQGAKGSQWERRSWESLQSHTGVPCPMSHT